MNALPYHKQVNQVEDDGEYFIGWKEEEGTYTIWKDDIDGCIPHTSYHYTNAHCDAVMTREEALARAKAECARLNEELEKKQKHE